MPSDEKKHIGIIGFGQIGASLVEQIQSCADLNMQIDFIYDYDGPTRGVLPLYPKNVNSHATLALATLGLDRTRSVLIADPDLDVSIIEIDAYGEGNRIHIERRNPIKGVSGKLTILSVMESIKNILGGQEIIRTC